MKEKKSCDIPRKDKEKCVLCGQKLPVKKRSYILTMLSILFVAILLNSIYSKVCKKEILLGAINSFFHLKSIKRLNLSKKTKEKIMYIAELASKSAPKIEEDNPGYAAEKQGIKKKHPITIIPGMANTNLELWKTKKESNSFFRKKIWGSHSTFTFMLHNRAGWFNSMKLDERTGLDPEKIKVRASPGLESSDFSFPGMWFWWKIVKNLSYIGYDIADIHFAAFDWRLGMAEMEARDGYFTKLKTDIEHQSAMNKEKVLVFAHSFGSVVFHYFLQWVSEKDKNWVNKHIHAIAYIGSPLLGAPKAISSLITGNALDVAEMGLIQHAILELLFGAEQRVDLFKTWTSIIMLLPKGGAEIWEGINEVPPPDRVEQKTILSIETENGKKNVSIETAFEMIKNIISPYNKKVLTEIIENKRKEVAWIDPLLSPLPNAPNLTIYSFYGIGIPTDRAYILQRGESDKYKIHSAVTDTKQSIFKGIYTADGDGTVPVTSSGYMGYAGWKKKDLNPSGVRTVNKEYLHMPSRSFFDLRGGPKASQHINILGNEELISDLLILSSGGKVSQRIISRLPEIAEAIKSREKKKQINFHEQKRNTECVEA